MNLFNSDWRLEILSVEDHKGHRKGNKAFRY